MTSGMTSMTSGMSSILFLCFCLITPSLASPFVLVAQPVQVTIPTLTFSTPYSLPGLPHIFLDPAATLFPQTGPVFTPTRTKNVTDVPAPAAYASRLAARNLDLCYYLGNDIFNSHVACNQNWADGTTDGVKKYINELTFETNRMIGEHNLKLVWKGPYERHDAKNRYPADPARDTVAVSGYGCDAVVFLVFNEFAKDCKTAVYGHKYGGASQGGMCEAASGSGYAIIVDQGFLEDAWTGPQILAHHIIKMLVSDNPGDKTCPNKESLLYPQLLAGKQRVDQCVVEKLNQSRVSQRQCMQN